MDFKAITEKKALLYKQCIQTAIKCNDALNKKKDMEKQFKNSMPLLDPSKQAELYTALQELYVYIYECENTLDEKRAEIRQLVKRKSDYLHEVFDTYNNVKKDAADE